MDLRLECAGLSDVGRVRKLNEDALFTAPDCGVCAVADGMGGHEHGEVASALAIETLARRFTKAEIDVDDTIPIELTLPTSRTLGDRLKDAVDAANMAIHARSSSGGRAGTMGTTIVALGLRGEESVVAHVGDSRAYLYRDGKLTQITRDHSFVWDLYEQGVISFADMRSHPRKNVITRALGTSPEVVVDLNAQTSLPGDLFLLCSDGLSGMLTDPEIAEILAATGTNLRDACRALVQRANERGGDDNITVVLARVVAADGNG